MKKTLAKVMISIEHLKMIKGLIESNSQVALNTIEQLIGIYEDKELNYVYSDNSFEKAFQESIYHKAQEYKEAWDKRCQINRSNRLSREDKKNNNNQIEDISKNKESELKQKQEHEEIISRWNQLAEKYKAPTIKSLTNKRYNAFNNVCKKENLTIQSFFDNVDSFVAKSTFLKEKYTIKFDWITNHANYIKTSEGNYADTTSKNNSNYSFQEMADKEWDKMFGNSNDVLEGVYKNTICV